MQEAMRLMMQNLSTEETRQVLELVGNFKTRFADLARQMLNQSEAMGLDPRVGPTAISTECLLLAAYLHIGSIDTFVAAARAACASAETNIPKTGTMQ